MARPFSGRGGGSTRDPRLPPGQYDTGDTFPVLTAEVSPRTDLATWTLRVDGAVSQAREWTWDQFNGLPTATWEGDIHCVTTWSKLGTSFTGVSVDVLLDAARPTPGATHVVAWSSSGYTTNLPLDDVTGGKAWVVTRHEDGPLPHEHGGPARLLVPHLYFWKSAKWLNGLRLLDHDEPGFWETRGYHHRGDPWTEQRYAGD